MKLTFDYPTAEDCPALTDLVYRSKASHGYDARFMELCRDEIAVSPENLAKGPARMAWSHSRSQPIGFAQIVETGQEHCELQALFIDPGAQGLGCGQTLFFWAMRAAKKLGQRRVIINSDPGALGFYLRVGAVKIGDSPSGSIPGRFLPRLSFDLTAIDAS